MDKTTGLRMEHERNMRSSRPPVMEGSEHFITTMDEHIMQRISESLGINGVSMELFRKSFNG